MRVICRAGKWTEITVIPSHVFSTLVELESKNGLMVLLFTYTC